MMTTRHFMLLIVLVVLLAAVGTHAQVQVAGKYGSYVQDLLARRRLLARSDFMTVVAPFQNTSLLLQQSLKNRDRDTFAKPVDLKVDSRKDGVWEYDMVNNVKTWTVRIRSKTAVSLSLIFNHFHLSSSAEVYVINEFGSLGAFTARVNNKADKKFATTPLKGEEVFLIYVRPMNDGASEQDYLEIGKISHGFKSVFAADASGPCNIDVRCELNSPWRNQIRSVAVFMTNNMSKFCTGVMLNSAAKDGRQLFMTANHCVYTDLSNGIAGFNYEKSACNSGRALRPQTAHGMKLLARWAASDFAIFEIQEKIPSAYRVYLAGWDSRRTAATDIAGIHHPSGDVKKISFFKGTLRPGSWSERPNRYHWIVQRWTRGVTEKGSSGSPIFNLQGQVIGQLHGGRSDCDFLQGSDIYGGFAFSFNAANNPANQLKSILCPRNENLAQLDGMELSGSGLGGTAVSPVNDSPFGGSPGNDSPFQGSPGNDSPFPVSPGNNSPFGGGSPGSESSFGNDQ